MSDAQKRAEARTAGAARSIVASARASGIAILPPLFAVIELAVFFGVVVALDWLLPTFDVSAISPNPFWLPVLLLSLQYGTVSGLLAAFTAIALTVLFGFPEQDVGENHFAYLLRIWGQPMLWLGAALLLGQFRMRQIAAKMELGRRVAELTSQRAAIADYAASLRQRCDALERQIAGRPEPSALGVMRALAGTGTGSSSEAFAAAVGAVFGKAEAALYLVDESGLRLAAAVPKTARRTARYPKGGALWRTVIEEGRAASVLERGGETALGGEGLVAVPVRGGADGRRIIGLIRLDEIDPALLAPATLAALDVIGRLMAPGLAGAPEATHATAAPALLTDRASGPAGDGAPSLATRIMRRVGWRSRDSKAGEPAGTEPATASPDAKSAVG